MKRSSSSLPLSLKPASLLPMFASIGTEVPGKGWAYEPKYDGIRVLSVATGKDVKLMTRNHKDKSFQFPELTTALSKLRHEIGSDFILDGEIVAISENKPARFQKLQARIHETDAATIEAALSNGAVRYIIFDVLSLDSINVTGLEWLNRREMLEDIFSSLFNKEITDFIQLSQVSIDNGNGSGKKLLSQAVEQGWEGVIAKQVNRPYQPGARVVWWQKLKIERRQEFVIGGFTDPRRSRAYFGALIIGYYKKHELVYAAHVGSGFNSKSLKAIHEKLVAIAQPVSPFNSKISTNEKPHWVKPILVAEVKFSQWTEDGRLRHPIFIGLRDDKRASEIKQETTSMQMKPLTLSAPDKLKQTASGKLKQSKKVEPKMTGKDIENPDRLKTNSASVGRNSSTRSMASKGNKTSSRSMASKGKKPSGRSMASIGKKPSARSIASIVKQLDDTGSDDNVIEIERGEELKVTNLDKVFFPEDGITKGDIMKYYTMVSPLILPVISGRPLVLRRFPEGINSEAFYQHQAGNVPQGVKTATVAVTKNAREQIIGGDLLTLLYTVQIGSISVDPWHSRVPHTQNADYAILDLDPGKRAPFSAVMEVVGLVKEVMDSFGLHGALKTSGATGMHIYLPLPPSVSNESAQILAELIATQVATMYPNVATVERAVKKRKATAVYVDFLQNIMGKTVASAYSVRARKGATVSTPLEWDELSDSLDPAQFTIATVLDRFGSKGDIWNKALSKPNHLGDLNIK